MCTAAMCALLAASCAGYAEASALPPYLFAGTPAPCAPATYPAPQEKRQRAVLTGDLIDLADGGEDEEVGAGALWAEVIAWGCGSSWSCWNDSIAVKHGCCQCSRMSSRDRAAIRLLTTVAGRKRMLIAQYLLPLST